MQTMIPNLCEDFAEKEELDFYRVLFQLGRLDCSYMSYSLERPDGKRINFFSDKEWLNVYNSQGFMKVCQLAMLCRHSKNTIIPWQTLFPATPEQKQVLDARSDFNIANGITFSQKINNDYEMIALATTKSNKKFINTLNDNKQLLVNILNDLRNLATRGSYLTI